MIESKRREIESVSSEDERGLRRLAIRDGGGFSNQTQFSADSHQSDAVESLGARVDDAIRKRQNFSRCISSWHIKAVLSFLVSSPVKLKLGCNALSAGK